MQNQIQSIAIEKLVAHPDNPNVMSKAKLNKLVRHIERTGRYEPIIIRPVYRVKRSASENKQYSERSTQFEIINGHYRVEALKKLGRTNADCLVWDLDDKEADMYLLTLNQLGGRDVLDKKITLLHRLNQKITSRELGKLLPQTAKQIERLTHLKLPSVPESHKITHGESNNTGFLNPVVFFVSNQQREIIQRAISMAQTGSAEKTKAKRNAEALTIIAKQFEENTRQASQTIKEKPL